MITSFLGEILPAFKHLLTPRLLHSLVHEARPLAGHVDVRIAKDRAMTFIKKFVKNNKAATAIEYGLIAALIAVAAIAAMRSLGSTVANTFNTVATNMS